MDKEDSESSEEIDLVDPILRQLLAKQDKLFKNKIHRSDEQD
jgi:hypothetical protein